MRLALLFLLLSAGASTLAEARTATEAPGVSSTLAGTEWQLVAIRVTGGRALAPEGEGDFTIAFDADGVFTGQADCNQYGGTYRTEPDSISGALVLGSAATTIAACAPVSSSRFFFAALNSVVRYDIAGDRLTLGCTQGRALVFERMGEMPSQETLQDFTYTCPGPGEPFSFRIRTGPGEVAGCPPASTAATAATAARTACSGRSARRAAPATRTDL